MSSCFTLTTWAISRSPLFVTVWLYLPHNKSLTILQLYASQKYWCMIVRLFFKRETQLASESIQMPHHCSLPWFSWYIIAFKHLDKKHLQVFKKLAAERQLHPQWRLNILHSVQSALNNSLPTQNGKCFPLSMLTRMPRSSTLLTFTWSSYSATAYCPTCSENFHSICRVCNLGKLSLWF